MHDFWGSKLIAFQPPLDIQKPGKNIEISTDLTTREPEKTSLFDLRKVEETPGCWTALEYGRTVNPSVGIIRMRRLRRFFEVAFNWDVEPVVAQFRCFSLVFELRVKPGNLFSFIIQGSLMFSRLRCLQILIIFERKKDRFGFQKIHFLRISFLKSYFDAFLSSLRIYGF